jgi:sugar/nucleoside kinase (ribokinase family)
MIFKGYGGKGANKAIAASRLGSHVSVIAKVKF